VTRGRAGVLLFLGAAILGGVGGGFRFAFADVGRLSFQSELFGVALMSAVGAALRIALQDFAVARRHHLRIGMFAANLLGTATLGFALEWPNWWIAGTAFTVGFCGGLTTFSGFIAEARAMLLRKRVGSATAFVVITLIVSSMVFVLLHRPPPMGFPWRTMIVNLSGCFLFGVLDKGLDASSRRSELHRLLLSGLLGGFTTLSTLVAETFAYGAVQPVGAAANVVLQLLGGGLLMAVGSGIGGRFTKATSICPDAAVPH
jgi:fluoride ion exporter CrcB/FEX